MPVACCLKVVRFLYTNKIRIAIITDEKTYLQSMQEKSPYFPYSLTYNYSTGHDIN